MVLIYKLSGHSQKDFSMRSIVSYPIDTLPIPLQDPILDHVTPDSCGVIVVLGNDEVEFLLGILGGGR